jgi:beta-lactamase superfamily II metal-dependent hydrolase
MGKPERQSLAGLCLARLSGRAVLRTDQRGNITLSTDGEQLRAEAER